jgi:hypothetical protein
MESLESLLEAGATIPPAKPQPTGARSQEPLGVEPGEAADNPADNTPPVPLPEGALPAEPTSLRDRLLLALAMRPYDDMPTLSRDLGVSPMTIALLVRTDEFKLALAERCTLGQLRAKSRVMESAVVALGALDGIMANPEAPVVARIEAAKVVLGHSQLAIHQGAAGSGAASPVQINVAISADDLSRARNRAAERAASIVCESDTLVAASKELELSDARVLQPYLITKGTPL